jgi:hypothetical protein
LESLGIPVIDTAFVLPVQAYQLLPDGSLFLFSIIMQIPRYGAGKNIALTSLRKKSVSLLFKLLDTEADLLKGHPEIVEDLKVPLQPLELDKRWIVCDGLFRDGLTKPIMSVSYRRLSGYCALKIL